MLLLRLWFVQVDGKVSHWRIFHEFSKQFISILYKTRSLCRCLAPSITFLSSIRDKEFRLHRNEQASERARAGDLGRKLLHDALKLNNVVKTECYPLHLCTFIKDLSCRFSLQMLWIMKFSLAKIFSLPALSQTEQFTSQLTTKRHRADFQVGRKKNFPAIQVKHENRCFFRVFNSTTRAEENNWNDMHIYNSQKWMNIY